MEYITQFEFEDLKFVISPTGGKVYNGVDLLNNIRQL